MIYLRLKRYCLQCARSVPLFFTFQQCNAPAAAHWAWETINLLERQIPVLLSFHHIFCTQQHAGLQKIGRNATADLPISWRQWTEAALDQLCLAWFWAVPSMTQVISGTDVSVWFSCASRFWAFNLTPYNAYFILPIIFVNSVNIKQELLCYVQQNFAVSVFCVL